MKKILCVVVLMTLLLSSASAQSTKLDKAQKNKSVAGDSFQTTAATVGGGGTIGRIPKWTNAALLGDSNIFEDKFGKIGIGTTTPTSQLTVQGMIEITIGGLKFPDGTLQTTAGLASVVHDSTLAGNGSTTSPLGVAIPLILSGSVNNGNGVITATNIAAGGPALFATGGTASATVGGGTGVLALGGNGGPSGFTTPGGLGIVGFGGSSVAGAGGTGGSLIGGVATAGNGGDGAFAVGALGVGTGNKGGRGIIAIPGGGAGGAVAGLAGEFLGDVEVNGNLSKGGGSFKIDHPLDPENKYLYHSFVESPDMMNIYNGNITTDANGEATVALPDWFQALNKDFRYQLTVVGTFAQAIVGEKVKDNRFTIKTSVPGVEVSWQVTGIRKDAFANKHRIPVEEAKPEQERGYYLHPDAFNKSDERGIKWARHGEAMRQVKEMNEEAQKTKQN